MTREKNSQPTGRQKKRGKKKIINQPLDERKKEKLLDV